MVPPCSGSSDRIQFATTDPPGAPGRGTPFGRFDDAGASRAADPLSAVSGCTDVVRRGLDVTVTSSLRTLLGATGAHRAVLVARQLQTGRVRQWSLDRADASAHALVIRELGDAAVDDYFFAPDRLSWHAIGLDESGALIVDVVASGRAPLAPSLAIPRKFVAEIGGFAVAGFSVRIDDDVDARIFLIDPDFLGDRQLALTGAERLVETLAPIVHAAYLVHQRHAHGAAAERARIARELHDGIVQSVLGVQIELHALVLRAANQWPDLAGELGRLSGILSKEAAGVRELMQAMRPVDVGPEQLVEAIAEMVERFRRETGVTARFITKLDRVPLSPRSCGEVLRIVQEALVNVRKHSGARNVIVRFAAVKGECVLSIDDDGRGFGFTGRLTTTDLERSRKGPGVIRERVRLLGGTIVVESDPRCGAHLEITVPLTYYAFQDQSR